MQQYKLKKSSFNDFVNKVIGSYDVIAPVLESKEKQNSKSFFKEISSPDEISFIHTYYPVKGYFFDPKEVLFEFKGDKVINPSIKLRQRVFFGLRRCDLNGILHQDMVFIDKNTDSFYKARRDASVLIGYHCTEAGDNCFCNSFELKDFFDLMFYDKSDFYAVEAGSEKGRKFAGEFRIFFEKVDNIITKADRTMPETKKLNSTEIKNLYNNDAWKKGADMCIACGACNFLCPNCHCFTINDEVDFDLKSGKRIRTPESCQLKHFTRVAGDHIFRTSKLARFKHRIFHQIQYFKDRHGVVFCTGCGRCITGCPARIDWTEIINSMKE